MSVRLIKDEWAKVKGFRKAALTVLADSPTRSKHEHARMVWTRYIQLPLGNPREKNTSSIEDVSHDALTTVLSLMRFTQPEIFDNASKRPEDDRAFAPSSAQEE